MKKLISILVVVMVIGLGACSPSQDYDDTALQNEVDVLEQEIEALQLQVEALEQQDEVNQNQINELNDRIDNLVVSVGINGQTSIYENQAYLSRMSFVQVKESDVLDKAKFPEYIWDTNDEYITVDDLANKLAIKYFGVSGEGATGFQISIRTDVANETDLTNEEIMARVSLLILELSNYDFYTIDTSRLIITFTYGYYSNMVVRMSLLVSPNYNLVPEIFYELMLDATIENFNYDVEQVRTLVTQYQTDETFAGYVLPNYK